MKRNVVLIVALLTLSLVAYVINSGSVYKLIN